MISHEYLCLLILLLPITSSAGPMSRNEQRWHAVGQCIQRSHGHWLELAGNVRIFPCWQVILTSLDKTNSCTVCTVWYLVVFGGSWCAFFCDFVLFWISRWDYWGKYKEHVYFWDPAMRDEKGRGVRTVLLQRQPKGFSAQTQLGTPNPTNPQKSPLGNWNLLNSIFNIFRPPFWWLGESVGSHPRLSYVAGAPWTQQSHLHGGPRERAADLRRQGRSDRLEPGGWQHLEALRDSRKSDLNPRICHQFCLYSFYTTFLVIFESLRDENRPRPGDREERT